MSSEEDSPYKSYVYNKNERRKREFCRYKCSNAATEPLDVNCSQALSASDDDCDREIHFESSSAVESSDCPESDEYVYSRRCMTITSQTLTSYEDSSSETDNRSTKSCPEILIGKKKKLRKLNNAVFHSKHLKPHCRHKKEWLHLYQRSKMQYASPFFETITWQYLVVSILGLIVLVIFSIIGNRGESYGYKEFAADLDNMKLGYSLTDESTLKIDAGIQLILAEKSTASFVFTYGRKSFTPALVMTFIEKLSSMTSKYLRNNTNTQPIILDQRDLSIDDQDYLLTNYRQQLEQCGVLAVRHLETVPAKTALAFHYFCDEYYPLVKNSAIFLLLDVRECEPFMEASNDTALDNVAIMRVERCLLRNWSVLGFKELKSLLARVVNVVIDLDDNII